MGGFRVITRLVALGRIAILARLLAPSQFGAFGIAAIVLAFLEIFTETGVNVFLVQEKNGTDKYINTAWVISIFRGILISAAILLVAPLISSFFNSPEALPLLYYIGLVPFLRGFINPSIIKFQKELQFNREFWLRTSVFILGSLVAVLLAIITRSAVSLIWGIIAGAFLEVMLSFIIVKPRPKFEFKLPLAKRIIGRGKWVTASGIFTYLSQQGDDAVVGKLLNTASLGLYQMAYKLSTLPLTEITQVAGKVTFPVFVRISDDLARLKRAFLKTTIATSLLIIPFGLILFLFPKEIITIILGKNWLEAVSVLKVLVIFGVIRAIEGVPNSMFLALKKQKWVAKIHLVQLIGLAIFIIPLTLKYGLVGAGIASIISTLVPLPLIVYYLSATLGK